MENKEAFLKKIGANIKEIRKSKKQEVKDAASGLGISVQALGAIENGKVDLNVTRVFEIAQYFKVDSSKILNVKQGDVFNFSSQNNSGGYHVQTIGVLNVTDENLKNYFENDIAQLKEKIIFFEGALKKGK
jgi:transcriptional regulator with XRE-family HTH domain